MRLVLDTNVVLSALLWRGTPYRLLLKLRQNEDMRVFTSPRLLAELAGILKRPGPAKRIAQVGTNSRILLAAYLGVVEVVIPDAVPRLVPDDPDDDHVVAAAVSAQAQVIVSGDRHLLGMGVHQSIRVTSPADFLMEIERG